MVKMRFIIALLLITVLANCQEDKKFKVRMIFEQGLTTTDITFLDGSRMTTAPTGTGTVTWEGIVNKPSFSAVAVLAGILKELWDKYIEKEYFDLSDLMVTFAGGLAAYIVYVFYA